jgi:putative selenate reductase
MNPSTSIEQLLTVIFDSYNARKEIFDIPEKLFYRHWYHQSLYVERYGKKLHNPIGLASGPLTQLAQNIVTGWICGARVIELKTVHPVANSAPVKPSIDPVANAHNCETSSELTPEQSFDQFLTAWIIIHIIHHKFLSGKNGTTDIGTIFIMSLGYTLADIRSEKILWFITKMMDCSIEKEQKLQQLKKIYPEIFSVNIPNQISNVFTINTYKGCSAREIEYICKFLMVDKKLFPIVKIDPILMGYNSVKAILKTEDSYDLEITDEESAETISYSESLQLIDNLQAIAKEIGVEFTLKVSNGLSCKNPAQSIPAKAETVYLTGSALHPVSVNLAAKFQSKYDGMLNISFSGGTDCFNISNLLMSGFSTITVCTDLLKPGGYGRLHQYFQEITKAFSNYQVKSIKELILKSASTYGIKESASENLLNYAIKTLNDPSYKRNELFGISIKNSKPLDIYDCISAPCTVVNPMHPDVAGYCHYTLKNDPDKAFASLIANNPLPGITAMAGMESFNLICTRLNYDQPVMMNDIERFISEYEPATEVFRPWLPRNKQEVAIIGAGAAGLSCGWFLNRLGFEVDIFESEAKPGGYIQQAVPGFRISQDTINRDINRLKTAGVKILNNSAMNKERYETISANYDFVFIATGAPHPIPFDFQKTDIEGIMDGIDFIHKAKSTQNYKPGRHYAVLGSNYLAADAARTARRICGSDGTVTLITPEIFEKMSVDHITLKAIEDEDIEIFDSTWVKNIVADKKIATGLELAETEPAMKNNKIVPGFILKETGAQIFKFDVIITCPKRKAGNGFFNMKYLNRTSNSTATKIEKIFAGGAFSNPKSTLASAIADGKKAAFEIARTAGIAIPKDILIQKRSIDFDEIKIKRFHREKPVKPITVAPAERNNFEPVVATLKPIRALKEAARCLQCDAICNVCVNVCPNKAIVPFEVKPTEVNIPTVIDNQDKPYVSFESKLPILQKHQVIVLADWCNACGICNAFCPSVGSPNLNKLRVYFNKDAFNNESLGLLISKTDEYKMLTLKRNGNIFSLTEFWDAVIFENNDCNVSMNKKTLKIEQIDTFSTSDKKLELPELAELKILFNALKPYF